jgi:alkylation response protein AidB-like acyl-CoA dehydrogenase
VRTEAKPVDGGFVVTGEKVWSSHARIADYCLLLVRVGAVAGRYDGLTCMLLDLRDPAVEVRPLRQISGDADFAQIVVSGALIPAGNVVGEVGQGWSVAMATLAHERGTFGITLTARLAAQFRRLVETAHEAGVIDDAVVRHELTDLYVALDALRLTGYRAISSTGGPGPESTVLKLAWSTLDQRMCALAMRLSTGSATAALEQWRRYWLHERLRSRASSIEGGTSEILRSLIAERVLGLPRSR